MLNNKDPMRTFKSSSDSIIFTPARVKARLYLSSQLTLIGTNRHRRQNVVFQGLKMSYMQCSRVNYPTCSFKSHSDSIIFTPGRSKTTLGI
jgi:hypothetical protein